MAAGNSTFLEIRIDPTTDGKDFLACIPAPTRCGFISDDLQTSQLRSRHVRLLYHRVTTPAASSLSVVVSVRVSHATERRNTNVPAPVLKGAKWRERKSLVFSIIKKRGSLLLVPSPCRSSYRCGAPIRPATGCQPFRRIIPCCSSEL